MDGNRLALADTLIPVSEVTDTALRKDRPRAKKKKQCGIDWASARFQRVLLKIAYIGDAYSVGAPSWHIHNFHRQVLFLEAGRDLHVQ